MIKKIKKVVITIMAILIPSAMIYAKSQFSLLKNNIINGTNGNIYNFETNVEEKESLKSLSLFSYENKNYLVTLDINTLKSYLKEIEGLTYYHYNFSDNNRSFAKVDTIIYLKDNNYIEDLIINNAKMQASYSTIDYVGQAKRPVTKHYTYDLKLCKYSEFDTITGEIPSESASNIQVRDFINKVDKYLGYEVIDYNKIKIKFYINLIDLKAEEIYYSYVLKVLYNNYEYIENSENVKYGSTSNVITIDTNELFQDVYLFNKISENIINEYSKGKKTVVVTCKYGKYKDENGNTVYNGIDGNLFKIGDEVIPYKYNGIKDVPIMKYNDGTPMKFKVTSSELNYTGKINISLELLEIKK